MAWHKPGKHLKYIQRKIQNKLTSFAFSSKRINTPHTTCTHQLRVKVFQWPKVCQAHVNVL